MAGDRRFSAPETCPVCGVTVPANATACPECGSDERTGWSDSARVDGLDLPDEAFDYEEFVARELEGRNPRPRFHRVRWIVAVLMLLIMVGAMSGCWR